MKTSETSPSTLEVKEAESQEEKVARLLQQIIAIQTYKYSSFPLWDPYARRIARGEKWRVKVNMKTLSFEIYLGDTKEDKGLILEVLESIIDALEKVNKNKNLRIQSVLNLQK